MYRDLKPENIGFDVRGNAKIFDFGLAKELIDKDKVATDQYRASGRTGTRRYMAPEVVLCKYYGKPADVFSFSILFWEILSLSQPFKGYDYEKHAKLVVLKKKRPELKNRWPAIIQMTMKEGWDDKPANRPPFDQICDSLSGQFTDDEGISRSERLRVLETSEHWRENSWMFFTADFSWIYLLHAWALEAVLQLNKSAMFLIDHSNTILSERNYTSSLLKHTSILQLDLWISFSILVVNLAKIVYPDQ